MEIFGFFQRWDRLYTSQVVVYRRQIVMYKDGSRIVRVKSSLIVERQPQNLASVCD